MMKITDFDFYLPENLIAKYPTINRTASRLLCLNRISGGINHQHFSDILEYISPKDLLIINNSRVIPARVFGKKATGGKLEILIERILSNKTALAHIRCSKSPKPGTKILLGEDLTTFIVTGRQNELFEIALDAYSAEESSHTSVSDLNIINWLNIYGHMPLPPYIDRPDENSDQERYQTVYAEHEGSVAAPTAGLHFDQELLNKIKQQGTEIASVTLHVGAGTFQPVRTDKIEDHHMHSEWISVSQETCDAIIACKKRTGSIIAVGTTSVRSVETAAQLTLEASQKNQKKQPEIIQPYDGDTSIFLYPGKKFHIIDKLITNFHLPKSTLLMLVSAFASTEIIQKAYQEAVKQNYRFFSYGDAMLIY